MRTRIGLSLTVMLAVLAAHFAAVGAENGPLRALGAIPLGRIEGRIDHMAATPDGHWLMVAALGGNRLLKIDTQAGKVAAAVMVMEPQGVCYLPKSGDVAVASGHDGNLQFYSDRLAPLGIVRGLDDADNVRYDADANLVYAGYGNGALAVIDPDTAVQTARIPLDGHPESFQLETLGTRIFVNVPSAGEIEVIDRANRVLIAEWKLKDAAANFPMALDEAGKRLFVGTRNPPRMLVIETEAGKEIAMLSACGDTDDLFYDAISRLIFLSGGQGCVSLFRQTDSVSYDRLDAVGTFPGARTSLLVPSAHRLYVAVSHRGAQPAEIMVFAVP
ncbi:MAG TPA: hypothetical protein VGH29_09040 [Candidatus Binataceae bacterium]